LVKRSARDGISGVTCVLGKWDTKGFPTSQFWKGKDNTFLSLFEQGFLKRFDKTRNSCVGRRRFF
jgi:hypothetical protein